MAKRKQYITKEEPAYWTVIDRKDGNANWPFLPLFTSFSEAYAYAKEKNAGLSSEEIRFITSRLLFVKP